MSPTCSQFVRCVGLLLSENSACQQIPDLVIQISSYSLSLRAD